MRFQIGAAPHEPQQHGLMVQMTHYEPEAIRILNEAMDRLRSLGAVESVWISEYHRDKALAPAREGERKGGA